MENKYCTGGSFYDNGGGAAAGSRIADDSAQPHSIDGVSPDLSIWFVSTMDIIIYAGPEAARYGNPISSAHAPPGSDLLLFLQPL